MLKPKIVLAGGTGFFGKYLIKYFAKNKQIVVLTRGVSCEKDGVKYVNWDGISTSDWCRELENCETLINLSGKSINCRFTEENKKELLNSRLTSTAILAEAVQQADNPPKIWVNASAGAMYTVKSEPNTEEDLTSSTSFLAQMAMAWEEAFYKRELPKTRRVAIRISLIFGKGGGVFPVLKQLTKLGLGGKVGSGNQKVSWIHVQDACRAIEYIIEKEQLKGAINLSSTGIISNKLLMQSLRKAFNIKIGLPAPSIFVEMGTFLLRKEPSLLFDSVNFTPKKLVDSGFDFNYNELDKALENLAND